MGRRGRRYEPGLERDFVCRSFEISRPHEVGEATALRRLGIDVIENLPGVGQNFQDQVTIELARELGRQAAFDDVRDSELIPGPKASARDIEDLARLGATSFGHAVGACKIGVDEMAVVDPQLRVRGVEGLRVADSSVMPRIVTGPTNAPTFIVAGRAARMILA